MTLCTRCKRTDPSCGFRWEKRRGRPKSWCRDCENAYQREYYQRNLDVARARNAAVMRAARRDPEKRLRMQAIQRRCWENGGRERAREYKQRKKTEDFFGYMVQFARRFNQAISPDDLRAMWERQEGRCGLTGRPLEMIAEWIGRRLLALGMGARMTPDDLVALELANAGFPQTIDALRRLARIEAGAQALADELGLEPEEVIARALRFAGAAREMALRFHGVRGAPRLEEEA